MADLPSGQKLTIKQQRFIQFYLQTLNGTQAAIMAGYSKHTARFIAAENLTKPHIKAVLTEALKGTVMQPAEVLARMSAQARGDIGDIIDYATGKVDVQKARELGMTHLIRSIDDETVIDQANDTETHRLSVKLYDSQRALFNLARVHALYNDKLRVETWQDRALDDIRNGLIDFEALERGYGYQTAAGLFTAAGRAAEIPADRTTVIIDAPALTDSARQTGGDNSEPSDA